jgi:hypothetical protein
LPSVVVTENASFTPGGLSNTQPSDTWCNGLGCSDPALQADARKEYLCQLQVDVTIERPLNRQSPILGYSNAIQFGEFSGRSRVLHLNGCGENLHRRRCEGGPPYLRKADVAKSRRPVAECLNPASVSVCPSTILRGITRAVERVAPARVPRIVTQLCDHSRASKHRRKRIDGERWNFHGPDP